MSKKNDVSAEVVFEYTGKGCAVPKNVTIVRFHPSVVEVQVYAFYCCDKLRKVELNEGLQKIGKYAFEDCTSLSSITLPSTLTEIDHNDSFKLDKACIAKQKAPPLLTSHEYMINNVLENIDTTESKDLSQILVRSTILHGKLTELIHYAQDPKSDKGSEISVLEKKDIFEAIKDLEDKILKIKLTIDNKK